MYIQYYTIVYYNLIFFSKKKMAGSHDRTLSDTWGQVAHYYGFETAGGYKEAREKAQGGNWRDKVFTGAL